MANPENIEPFKMKKGETLNPKGRPKGSKTFSVRLKELLSGIDTNHEWTNPLAAELIKIIFSKNGSEYIDNTKERQKAINTILNRLEGMPKQTVEQTNLNADITDKTEAEISELWDKIHKE